MAISLGDSTLYFVPMPWCSEPDVVSCRALSLLPCSQVSVFAPVGQTELGGTGVNGAAGLSQALPPLLLQRNTLLW